MLAHRLRRWPNITATFIQCLVFAGAVDYISLLCRCLVNKSCLRSPLVLGEKYLICKVQQHEEWCMVSVVGDFNLII